MMRVLSIFLFCGGLYSLFKGETDFAMASLAGSLAAGAQADNSRLAKRVRKLEKECDSKTSESD